MINDKKWTIDPPTEPGWYWYFGGGSDKPYPGYVYYDDDEKALCINVLGYSLRVDEAKRYWIGPLPVPERPQS